ncbi:hypothetical protein I307_02728 [Cryptococcus deuterogattii 99/473]|uniref:Uncharacterized protein n=1 Tax=Cryptococcus deuterogattii Ram5 TaxID=1296110 RepID=A0A0D0UWZ2_9TREE|nr:hypothetical protein I313_05282 [Cryptococcus deuterogattii Ram5]KIR70829.1 hypothetical protein I310_05241 [Cryptococcus deuterogattii CA1014]KIY57655.1 hypothetical protein I307_02728 [Cryptococcus deuterogattii 99/473]
MGIEEQVLSTPPPQAVTADPLIPHNLPVLHLEKGTEQHSVRIALLEKELASVKAALALEKVNQGVQKRQMYPEGQLFDLLY